MTASKKENTHAHVQQDILSPLILINRLFEFGQFLYFCSFL